MPREQFRVKRYSHPRYKFVVRSKIAGTWRRRYFETETEARAYAEERNRSAILPTKGAKELSPVRMETREAVARANGRPRISERTLGVKGKTRQAVVVLGMHRSGTSAFCGALELLGVDFGRHLLPPSGYNEKGYWENPAIVTLHERLLHVLGSSWHDERSLPKDWLTRQITTQTQSALRDVLVHDLGSARVLGLKDPRMSRLIEMWFPIFQALKIKPVFIVALRHPWEVAQSLDKRDGLDAARSYRLWVRHLFDAELATRSYHRSFAVYDKLLTDPVGTLDRLRHELGLRIRPPVQRRSELCSFLEASLKHHTAAPTAHDASLKLVPLVPLELYETIRDAKTSDEIDRHISEFRASAAQEFATLQIFASREGRFREGYSNSVEFVPARWCRLKVDLPWGLGDEAAPLRIDPVNRRGLVDIGLVRLRSVATGEVLWRADTKKGLDEIIVRGSGFRIPHPRFLRLVSYGDDPQIHLPTLAGEQFQDPLSLDILLRYEPGAEAVDRAIATWNESANFSGRGFAPAAVPPPTQDNLAVLSPGAKPGASEIVMVVYSAGESGYSEERASKVTYTAEVWSHLNIALQLGLGTKPLRLDPLRTIGLVDVAAMSLRSAVTDDVLWRANEGGSLQTLQVGGSAVRIPHPHLARFLSYGDDPQIFLPEFPQGKFDGPLRLEIWLKTQTGDGWIRRGISELATITARVLEQDTQTRALLERATRDETIRNGQELEIAALKASLETVRFENVSQRGHIENLEKIRSEDRTEIIELKNALEIVRSEKESLRAELETRAGKREEHIRGLEAIRNEQELEIRALKASLETLRSENAHQRGHIENLEKIRMQLESELTKLGESLQRARQETTQFITELDTERACRASLEEQLEAFAIRHRQLEKQSEDLKNALESENAKFVATCADLALRDSELAIVRNELGVARNLHAGMASELGRVREQFAASENELAFARHEFSQLRIQLLGQKNISTELRLRLDATKETLRRQKSDLNRIKRSVAWKVAKPIRELESHFVRRGEDGVGLGSLQGGDKSSYLFWLEHPAEASTAGENIVFSGWIVGPSQQLIYGVQAVVGGNVFPGEYGFERTDVASVHGDRVGARHSGFAIVMELPVGLHEISLQALNNQGEWQEFLLHTHTVN